MSALLGSWSLVLNVDSGSTLLNEELGELHDGSQTAVSGISISDNWAEVVDGGDLVALLLWSGEALLTLLAVVEKLGHPQLVDLVWNSGVWVIGKIWSWLVGGRGSGGGLPSRDVDSIEILGHLSDGGWLETSVCVRCIAVLRITCQLRVLIL